MLRRKRRLRAGIVQLIAAEMAVALAVTAPLVDVGYQFPSSRAVQMLVTVAAGTVTFIGVVISLLFLHQLGRLEEEERSGSVGTPGATASRSSRT